MTVGSVKQPDDLGARSPRVSVVLPVYNGEPFLADAVNSVLEQTYRDFELIAIDGGSVDASGGILDRFAVTDSRMTVLHQPNTVMLADLNRGLELARGEFVARMDADDVAHPERFARQVAFLDAHPDIAVVGCAVTLIDESGERIRDVEYPLTPAAAAAFLEKGSPLAHPSVMMRRAAVLAVGAYRPAFRYAEDYDLWVRIAERYQIANLPDRLLFYRQHQTKQSFIHAVETRFATRIAWFAARCRRAGKPDPIEGMIGFAPQDIDRFDLSSRERANIQFELVEALLEVDPAMAKPDAARKALELFALADIGAADGTRLVRTMLMLAQGFARRGQPLIAVRWLWRAVTCRRNGFVDVFGVALGWARRRLVRRDRAARMG
jgi:glycosyltransferase involved in cell wall biosynthesis